MYFLNDSYLFIFFNFSTPGTSFIQTYDNEYQERPKVIAAKSKNNVSKQAPKNTYRLARLQMQVIKQIFHDLTDLDKVMAR